MGLETNSHVSDGWPERGMKKENKLTVPEITQVQQLIAPLRKNPQTILNKSDNDQETANGRQITRIRGRDTVSGHWTGLEAFATNKQTYGLIGSANVSSQSSILLVCSRMASRGLGSLVASALAGPPPKGFWCPRL